MDTALLPAPGDPIRLGDVLALFRRQPVLTRADVMARTGLSRSTVTQRLDALVAAGLVIPAGEDLPTRGRPANQFSFNAHRGVLLVADVGATATRTAVTDLSGAILFDHECASDVTAGPEAILGLVTDRFDRLLEQVDRSEAEVFGIGISVPGPVDFERGQVVSPPIMTGWDRYDIRSWFAPRFGCPVLVDKDVNAMAFGEQRTVYPDVAHLLMLKVGTGVGSGIIAGGDVYRGADGAAGDIGHSHHTSGAGGDEPQCRCGNTGCLEAYAGGWALVRDLQAAGYQVATVDDAVALIRQGDPGAARLARAAGRTLGAAIADAVSLLNPGVVVVCGQLSHAEEQLLAGIREMVYKRSLPLATRRLQIVRSQLDRRVGAIGLALLVADTIFEPSRVDALVRS